MCDYYILLWSICECLLFLWPWKYIKTASLCVHSWLDIPFAINFNCSTVNFSFSYTFLFNFRWRVTNRRRVIVIVVVVRLVIEHKQAGLFEYFITVHSFDRSHTLHSFCVLYRKYLFINQTESNRAQKKVFNNIHTAKIFVVSVSVVLFLVGDRFLCLLWEATTRRSTAKVTKVNK